MARDAIRAQWDEVPHEIAIEVRDDSGPVLQVKFIFEFEVHRRMH
jgi:hypothetical protein